MYLGITYCVVDGGLDARAAGNPRQVTGAQREDFVPASKATGASGQPHRRPSDPDRQPSPCGTQHEARRNSAELSRRGSALAVDNRRRAYTGSAEHGDHRSASAVNPERTCDVTMATDVFGDGLRDGARPYN